MFKKSISIFSFILALQASPIYIHGASAGAGTGISDVDASVSSSSRLVTVPCTPALDALTAFPGAPPTVKDATSAQSKSLASQISCWGWKCGTVATDLSTGMRALSRAAVVLDTAAVQPAIALAEIFPESPSRNAVLTLLRTMDKVIQSGTKVMVQANQYVDYAATASVSTLGNVATAYLEHLEIPGMHLEDAVKLKNGIRALVQVLTANNNLTEQLSQVKTLVDMVTGFLTTPTSTLSYNADTNTLAYNPNDPARMGAQLTQVRISEKDDFSFKLPTGQTFNFNVDVVSQEIVNLLNAYHTGGASSALAPATGRVAASKVGASSSSTTPAGANVGASVGSSPSTGTGTGAGMGM